MNKLKYIVSIIALTVAFALPAGATFTELPVGQDPGGIKLWNDVANKNVTEFDAFVGQNHPGDHFVHIQTVGPVDSGSGFATITPVKGGSLTDVIFTPDFPNLYSDFSFRGILTNDANDSITLNVTDNNGGVESFTFNNLGNGDFARRGIISFDATIAQIELVSDFKQLKQLEVSFGDAPPPGVPDGGSTVMLLGAALGALGMARRYLKK